MKALTKLALKLQSNPKIGRAVLKTRKYSPEIMAAVGAVSIIAGTVMACKATLKVEEPLNEAKENLDKVKTVLNNETLTAFIKEEYSEKDALRDKTIIFIQTAVKIGRLYLPAVALTTFGIGCMLGGHNILKKRNIALTAAYAGLDKHFKEYRNRVEEELGVEKERDIYRDVREEKVEVKENGKKKKKTEKVQHDKFSPYSRLFDETNELWVKDAEYNKMFLQSQQNYLNDLLQSRGHVFLNEVYDALGFDRTSAGAVVGWVKDSEAGDSFIDFGLYNLESEEEAKRLFINGYERSVLLDFNVDGVIYDKI